MSKIGEQLQDLRASIDNIKENMKKIKIENTLLQKQQENLVSEKAELVKKNAEIKKQVFQTVYKPRIVAQQVRDRSNMFVQFIKSGVDVDRIGEIGRASCRERV